MFPSHILPPYVMLMHTTYLFFIVENSFEYRHKIDDREWLYNSLDVKERIKKKNID